MSLSRVVNDGKGKIYRNRGYLLDCMRARVNAARKKTKFMMTIVAPAGRFRIKEAKIPDVTERMPERAEIMIVVLKPFAICRAVTGGRIRRAEMSIIPTTFMARTTVSAMRRTRILFIWPVFIPDAFADSSSKVMERSSS
jgi:hypothetical protein